MVTTAEGRIECAPHHDDWDNVDWEAPLGADGAVQRSLYQDVTSHVLPEGREWLLMELRLTRYAVGVGYVFFLCLCNYL